MLCQGPTDSSPFPKLSHTAGLCPHTPWPRQAGVRMRQARPLGPRPELPAAGLAQALGYRLHTLTSVPFWPPLLSPLPDSGVCPLPGAEPCPGAHLAPGPMMEPTLTLARPHSGTEVLRCLGHDVCLLAWVMGVSHPFVRTPGGSQLPHSGLWGSCAWGPWFCLLVGLLPAPPPTSQPTIPEDGGS